MQDNRDSLARQQPKEESKRLEVKLSCKLKPLFRCVPDKQTMRRIVHRYVALADKAREGNGALIPFEPYK